MRVDNGVGLPSDWPKTRRAAKALARLTWPAAYNKASDIRSIAEGLWS